jgi:quercetin dioxygenase-like cupin family protein
MRTWDLAKHDVEPQKPRVLGTTREGRAVLVSLAAGDSMSDHQVRERATVVVVAGQLEIEPADGESITGRPGTMVVFEPAESHAVHASEDSRFLLLLAPWSLEEHSSLDPWSRDA